MSKYKMMVDDAGRESYIVKRLPAIYGTGESEHLVCGTTYREMRLDWFDQCSLPFPTWESLEVYYDGRPPNTGTLMHTLDNTFKSSNFKHGAIIEIASGINTVFSVELLNDAGELAGSLIACVPPDKDRVIVFVRCDELKFDKPQD